jgi:hypothetical protein
MTPTCTKQRVALGVVWLLAVVVAGLWLAQIFDLLDSPDLILVAFSLQVAVIGLSTAAGWLPWRRK